MPIKYSKTPDFSVLSLETIRQQLEGTEGKIVLHQPNSKELNEVMQGINLITTKESIFLIAEAFRPIVHGKQIVIEDNKGKQTPTDVIYPMFTKVSKKGEMVKAMSYFFADSRNLSLYTNSLSNQQRVLWKDILLNFCCSSDTAHMILNNRNPIFIESPYGSFYSMASRPETAFFALTNNLSAEAFRYGYREKRPYLTITQFFYFKFFPLFFPEFYEDHSLDQLPERQYRIANFEKECIEKYDLLFSLLQTNSITFTTKSISKSSLKTASNQLGLTEYFDSQEPFLNLLHAKQYIEAIALAHSTMTKESLSKLPPYHLMLKQFFNKTGSLPDYFPTLLLPHIKGVSARMRYHNSLPALLKFVVEQLKKKRHNWIPIQDLINDFYTQKNEDSSLFKQMQVYDSHEQSDRTEIVNQMSNERIAVDTFVPQFGNTAFYSIAHLLCSLGMAELAYNPNPPKRTPFEQAQYLRLTKLGLYVVGITNQYQPPQIEKVAHFELDHNRLIIRSLTTPNPYSKLLLDTSTAISQNRFITSAQSFLAHCKNQQDVENKINIFRQFVSDELPPLWVDFFNSLLLHCSPLSPDYTSYRTYRISPQNTDLISLLTSDKTLRKLIVRAEGYLILIPEENHTQFVNELKKHGYLL